MSYWQIFSRASRIARSTFDSGDGDSDALRRAQELIDRARLEDQNAAAAAQTPPPSPAAAMNHARACEILGVLPAATMLEVAQAYRKIIVIHHPDHAVLCTPEEQQAARIRTQEINEAYSFLKVRLAVR